ncbi:MAG TPA: hypothetical protein VF666_07505 [Pyrinomonadaceae bacterium]
MTTFISTDELEGASGFTFRSSIAEDVWHAGARDVGAYEWWYFDAISDDARDVLVVIFLADFVFSPRYNRTVSRHLRQHANAPASSLDAASVAPRPTQVPAVAVCLYRDGRPLIRAINEYTPQDFDASTEHPACRIGRNRFQLETTPQETRYTITLDETLRRNQRLAATLHWTMLEGDFSKQHPSHQSTASPNQATASPNLGAHAHLWNMVAPRCRVSGTFNFIDPDGRATEQHFRGTGYHDHNRDRRWMPAAIDRWQWGRAHFEDATAVFYRYRERGDTTDTTRLFLIRHGELNAFAPRFTATHPRRDIFGIRYPRHMRFASHDENAPLALDIHQHRVIDRSYFYLRFLGQASLTIADARTRHATAITEHLAPRALRYRWLDWLTSMRIGRPGRASLLK